MKNKLLKLLDSLEAHSSPESFAKVLLYADLTEGDFQNLKSNVESLDEMESSIEYVLENFGQASKAGIEGLHLACYESLDLTERQEIAKKHIDSLWSKSKKDRDLMLELHEMLECELDTKEPYRNRIYNLTDTMDSVKNELESESPDYAKAIKWLADDLALEGLK